VSTIVSDLLPDRWKAVRLKFFTSRLYGLSQPPEYQPEGLPFVRATNVLRGKLVNDGLVFVSETDLSEPRAVRLMAGDIIVVRSGAYTGDSALVTADWVGGVAGFDIVVRVNRYAHPQFVAFSLLSPSVLEQQIEPMRSRAAQPHLNAEELGDVELMLPPFDEQRTIADYLDRETARLDALVAAKDRMLELLAEKRRALIARAVTRGLDPHAPLRDSGIPWLGEIPAHWEVQRLKFLVPRIEQGWSPECHNVPASDEEWGVLKAGCCNGGVFNQQENKSLPLNLAPPLELEVKPGDILMSRASGSTDLIGSVAMVPEGTRSRLLLSDKTYRIWLDTTRAIPSYFVIALESDVGRVQVQEVVSCAAGLANNIAQGDIKEFAVPLPPMDEQAAIVAHITAETAKMGALCAATERTIALLKERRAALIAAAVTGKLDVLGAERHLDVVAD
jgi:type I restriction enzyme, S subunit